MPRREFGNSHSDRSDRSDRAPRSDGPRSMDRRQPSNVSEQVLALREGELSYSAIAGKLSLRRAVDAHKAFIRAVGSRTGEEQRHLVANEQARLDRTETRIRTRDAADPEKIERRVQALDKLRAALP
jgi:hypothetical protein